MWVVVGCGGTNGGGAELEACCKKTACGWLHSFNIPHPHSWGILTCLWLDRDQEGGCPRGEQAIALSVIVSPDECTSVYLDKIIFGSGDVRLRRPHTFQNDIHYSTEVTTR